MDELVLGSLVAMLMRSLEGALEGGEVPENTQIVVRPIFTWPDGRPGLWIMVNWPN